MHRCLTDKLDECFGQLVTVHMHLVNKNWLVQAVHRHLKKKTVEAVQWYLINENVGRVSVHMTT